VGRSYREGLFFTDSESEPHMTDPQSPIDKMATAAAGVSASVQEAAHEAKPAFERLADRLSDSISEMAHHSRDTAIETRKLLAQKTQQATSTAEHCIQRAPFKSVFIALGVGAVAATLVSWLMRPRDH
jgi:ElaB/YqjD/DUF883 family membrane-anchored ribosome-binding protein